MAPSLRFSASTVWKYPWALTRYDEKGIDPVNLMKAQREVLREVYRRMRDNPKDYDVKRLPPGWSGVRRPERRQPVQHVSHITFTKPKRTFPVIVDDRPIRWRMKSRFPKRFWTLIDHAAFIERYVTPLPENQLPLWVSVPLESIYSITEFVLSMKADFLALQRVLAMFLWGKLNKDKDDNPTWFLSPSRLYEIAGMSDKSFRVSHKDEFGIRYQYKKKIAGYANKPLTYGKILWNEAIPTTGTTYDDLDSYQSETKYTPPDLSNESHIEHVMELHNFYYPQQPYQTVDETVPFIMSDGYYVSIPLVPSIVPALILYLIPTDALYSLLKLHTINPKRMIVGHDGEGGLQKRAFKSIEHIKKHVKYPPYSWIQSILPKRDWLAYFMKYQYYVMKDGGLPIDVQILRQIKPQDDPQRSKEKNIRRRESLNRTKESILGAVARNENGYCQGVHHFNSLSERVYYRREPLQNFPAIYRPAVVAPKGKTLVYLDIVSNDLTMLFNLAGDATGLNLIRDPAQGDPYSYIAEKALLAHLSEDKITKAIRKVARSKVKSFINPWLYGATKDRIIDEGLTEDEYTKISKTTKTEFRDSVLALKALELTIKKNYTIPEDCNPVENRCIPCPPIFARRVAPSMLIQRTGANLMKKTIFHFMDEEEASSNMTNTKILLTIHDSIIGECPKGQNPEIAIADLLEAMRRAIFNTPIQILNVRAGTGKSWTKAETHAKQQEVFRLPMQSPSLRPSPK